MYLLRNCCGSNDLKEVICLCDYKINRFYTVIKMAAEHPPRVFYSLNLNHTHSLLAISFIPLIMSGLIYLKYRVDLPVDLYLSLQRFRGEL